MLSKKIHNLTLLHPILFVSVNTIFVPHGQPILIVSKIMSDKMVNSYKVTRKGFLPDVLCIVTSKFFYT